MKCRALPLWALLAISLTSAGCRGLAGQCSGLPSQSSRCSNCGKWGPDACHCFTVVAGAGYHETQWSSLAGVFPVRAGQQSTLVEPVEVLPAFEEPGFRETLPPAGHSRRNASSHAVRSAAFERLESRPPKAYRVEGVLHRLTHEEPPIAAVGQEWLSQEVPERSESMHDIVDEYDYFRP